MNIKQKYCDWMDLWICDPKTDYKLNQEELQKRFGFKRGSFFFRICYLLKEFLREPYPYEGEVKKRSGLREIHFWKKDKEGNHIRTRTVKVGYWTHELIWLITGTNDHFGFN